jgi:hypothetical protein
LDGQIKTAEEWKALDLYPGHPTKLICQGFCHCSFEEVREKAIYEPVLNGNGYHAEPVV